MGSEDIKIKSSHQKQLGKAALISSPLLALLSIGPMTSYLRSIERETIPVDMPQGVKPVLVFLLVSFIVYVIWQLNIALRNRLARHVNFTNRKIRTRMLIPSFLIVISVVLVVTGIREFVNPIDLGTFKYYPMGSMIVNNFIILLIMNFIDSTQENTQLRLEKSKLEVTYLMAAHDQLKQQIQPHFLFNALSNLQVMIKRRPDAASTYVEVLSNFLRNSIQFNAKDLVTISEDLSVLQDYITIQQLRFDSSIILEVDIPDHARAKKRVPVFCLQLLGENAIKHNMFTAEAPLRLSIKYDATQDRLLIENNRAKKYQVSSEKSGTGLINLKKRFELETTDIIQITSDDHKYLVSLPLL